MVNGLHQRHTARWTQISDIEHHLQNAFVESFNGRYRDECLDQYWFTSIEDAATLISKWKHDYNTLRPHSALGNMTPLQFRLAAEEANRLLKENKLDLTGNIKTSNCLLKMAQQMGQRQDQVLAGRLYQDESKALGKVQWYCVLKKGVPNEYQAEVWRNNHERWFLEISCPSESQLTDEGINKNILWQKFW